MKAQVYKSTGSWYLVKNNEDKFFNARIKGIFKLDDITSTNPIAVGDFVEMNKEEDGSMTIHKIHARNNYIIRTSPHNKNQKHIVASNLDQAILFATLKEPKTSNGFIDRFLITAEAFHIPAIIVFNKSDIYQEKETNLFETYFKIYSDIGYHVILMSLQSNEGGELVKNILKNKTTLLSGHSGVGKSSFINSIFPEKKLKTNEVSDWSGKGMHTTTFAEMFDLPFSGKIIDTPGVKEFGIAAIEKQEVSHFFPEMKKLMHECKFNNCMHLNEPDCAIKKALEEGIISIERYVSYNNILDSIINKSY
jgi:ribosome biogenesis GTPase